MNIVTQIRSQHGHLQDSGHHTSYQAAYAWFRSACYTKKHIRKAELDGIQFWTVGGETASDKRVRALCDESDRRQAAWEARERNNEA